MGEAYADLFARLLRAADRHRHSERLPATLAVEPAQLPPWRFQHLLAMSDSTGVLQHAVHAVPDFSHGYCTDDNARALLLSVQLEGSDDDGFEALRSLQIASAAFLQHAFVAETGRFRNFMAFDRRWLEPQGSEDSHGRALWSLGAVVGRTRQPNLRNWAARLFERALPALETFTSPRAWAFAVLGLHDYLRILDGDRLALRWRLELAERLLALFRSNARLPQALIISGRWLGRADMLETGLEALAWLQRAQTSPSGHYRPVGSEGFWLRGATPALHDQQPLEAAAAVAACLEAFHATADGHWRQEATRAFDWYLGGNDLQQPVYDAINGGCYDGLQPAGLNRNQGAESTLAFLMALADMRAIQGPA